MVDAHRRLPDGRTLSDVMEFDHVILVRQDGTVTDGPSNVYAPMVYWHSASRIEQGDGWELMNGYSGQQSYSGPVMHPSEFIGGRLADDILSTPGLYVAVVVTALEVDADEEDDIVGWAVARKDIPHADYPHEPGRLYDCAACEAQCFCGDNCPTCLTYGETATCRQRHEQCVYSGEHATNGQEPGPGHRDYDDDDVQF